MRNSATPPSLPRFASRRSPAAVPLRGGRLTKVDGEVASFAPSLGKAAPALLSCTSIAGALTGAFLALTAQEARAACTESAGVWTCTGVVTAAQSVKRSGSAISVNLDSGFDMDVAQGVGFTLEQSGAGGIAFVQAAGGQEIVGHSGAVHATNSGAGDISVTATGALGKTGRGAVVKIVNSDASGGSVSVSVGSVSGLDAGGHAVEVRNSGSGTTAVAASGSIISGSGQGDGVNVQTGGGSGSVSVSVATVTGQRTGVRVSHSGSGSVSVSAVGTVEADGGYGGSHAVYVANRGSDASISVAVAAVSAQRKRGAADGIHVLQMHGGAVTVTASGSVSSAGRHGIFVDLRRQGGTPGQKARGDVNIRVSGSVTGGGGSGDAAIKVNSSGGDDARVVLGSGAVVGRAGEDGIVDSSGNALVEVKAGAALRGDVRLGSGDDALSIADGAAVSGEVDLGDGADTVTVSGAEVSGEIFLGDGSDTLTVSGGAALVGYAALGDGDDLLTVTDGSKVSGGVALWNGDDRATVSDGAEVSNHMGFGYGSDTLIVSGAKVSGDVDFGYGSDTMVVSEAAEVSGGLDFGDGGDTLTIGDGAKVSGEVNFGSGGDSFNFGPGFSEVSKAVRGAERFTFESGAVAHIVDTGKADMSGLASLEIKGGAIAILDNAGHRHKVGSILLKPGGTLNIADGVAGTKGINYPHVNNAALLLGRNQEFNGTLIIDANFAQSWGDALAWDGAGTRNWRGTVLIEPAVLAGRQGGTAIITNNLSASQIRVPDGFSVFYDNVWQQLAVRQDMADGGCTDAGSGVFACSDLIHKTQSFNSSGGALAVALGSTSVVHALAGTQQGLSLRQSGVGGISLTQSAAGGRIAAAGHAIHVRNSGAGVVSISVTGAVVGGLTGRVADAGGIVAEGGADGGGVRISAASVTGLLHGISASGGGGVSIEAAGSVIGRLGDGVAVESGVAKGFAIKGSVSVSVATVTGGRAGVRVVHRGDGSVSVRADGAVSASGGHGDSHAISVKAHGLDSSIAVVAGTVAAHGTGAADGIHVRQPHRGSVTVSASGAVSSAGRHGVFVDQRSRGRNMHGSVRIGVSGSVTGAAAAIRVESDSGDSVRISLESGAVVGRAGEVGILESRGSAAVDVKSGAAVKGGVELGAGDDTLTVSGATVSGDVDLGAGDDTLTLSSATVFGKLDLSVGGDTLTVSDGTTVSGGVEMFDGSDTLTVRDGAAVVGGVDLGAGDDTLTVSSATVSGDVDPGAGDDTLTLSGATVSGELDLSVGSDTLDVSDGTMISGGVEMFDGSDTMIVRDGATVSGGIDLGSGDDTLTVSGATVSGGVNPGAGDDTLIFSSATVSGKLDLSVGSDTLTVSDGTTVSGGVEMFDGADILTVSSNARVSGGVNLGAGDDTLTVSGATVSGGVNPGAGDDTLIFSSATVSGKLDLSVGSDTLTVSDGTTVSGGVEMFDGADILTVSSNARVSGGVNLGAGDDTLTVSGATVSGGVNPGAGDDTLIFSSATVSGKLALSVGSDTLTVSDGTTVSGGVEMFGGSDILTVSNNARVSGGVDLGDGNDTATIRDGATVSGGVRLGTGHDTLTVIDGATVSGNVDSRPDILAPGRLKDYRVKLTVSDGARISGSVNIRRAIGTVIVSGRAQISGSLRVDHGGQHEVTISGGAKVGSVSLWASNVKLTVSDGATISGDASVSSFAGSIATVQNATVMGRLTLGGGMLTVGDGAKVYGGVRVIRGTIAVGDGAKVYGGVRVIRGTIAVSGAIAGGLDVGDNATLILRDGARISGGLDFSSAVDMTIGDSGAVYGNVWLGIGDDTLAVIGTTTIGLVSLGYGNDTLALRNATIGGVWSSGGSNTVMLSEGATVSGDVSFRSDGDNTVTLSDGSTVSRGVIFRRGGNHRLTLGGGAKVSGGVNFTRTGDNTVTLSGGAKISGGVIFTRTGDNTVTLSGGAKISGGVRFTRTGDNTVTLSGGAKVSGGVFLSDGDDTLTVSNGATVSGDVDFRSGYDNFNFGHGLSEVTGKVMNAERFTFDSGAVVRIAHTDGADFASVLINGGAVAILDNAGLAHSFDSIFLKQGGTLNIADGVAGSSEENGTFSNNTALSLRLDQEFSGTLIIDANFDEAWADGLAWKGGGSRTWKGTAHVEPAVVAGRKGGSATITHDVPAGHFTVSEGFSIVHDAISGRTSIRQDMADGACTSSGSGAFACTDLIHETQSLSATGEALNVTLDRAGVVHALAGLRRGLSLSQSGTGGISLTQSSTGSRIAAAGHAIHARNTGAGGVSVAVTGLVVGGRTGRVANADGIAAENGADGSGVRISAVSVAGLRHGIAALAGAGGVSVEASGPVTGWFGDGVRAIANGGDVAVKAASASGGSAGILGSGTGAVSIRASGAAMATGSGGVGIDGLATGSGALSISATEAAGDAFGIRAVSQGSGSVSVTASGMVKAMGAEGAAIHGFAAGGGALSISAAGASGGNFGVKAVGSGSGSVSVSASGGVSSMNGASRHGVHARASGTGGLTVSVDGDVRGGETGITALGGEGGDVAVTTSGGVAFGGGSVDGAAGIHAAARNGDLTVSASGEWHDAIVGFGDGIRVASSGTGAVSVSATVKVLVKNGDGIRVRRTQAGSVGISVSSLTAASRLPGTAGTAAAISADAPSGSSVTIALNSGAHLMMPGADAVIGGAGDAAVAVKPGATVQGRISLGSGTDTLVFEGGALSGVERIDGGAGKDTLRFAGGSGTLHASVQSEGLKGWERIVVESGASLSGGIRLAADSGSLEFRGSAPSGALDGGSGNDNFLGLFNVGTASVPASDVTGWETIAIGAGSEISFGRGSTSLTTRTLNLEKGGTLNVGNDADTGDALTVSGDFGGGGTVVLDANFMPGAGASDRLTVTGDVRGETSVVVAKVGERGTVDAAARPQRIDGVISVGGAVAVGAFSLGSPIKFGTVGYSLAFDPENREFDLLRIDAADGDSGALSLGAVGLHSGPAATAALHSGPVVAAALHMGPAAAPAQATASAGPGLGGAVRPACAEAPSGSGAFSCGGDGVSSPQRLGATGATALSVKLDTRTEVDTNGTAFSLTQSGTGGIAFERKEGGAAIRAKGDAIAARNAGGGFVSISARGAIAAGGDGVSAISDADGEGVRIDVATVAAGGDGVSVEAAAGGVSVTADDAKGGVAGIRVRTGDGGTGVEISAGSAEGGVDGISVDHGGGGEVRITATGAVSGARGDGVHARSEAGHVSVRVSGAVSGGAAAGSAAIRTDGASAAVTLESGASVRAAGGGSAVMDGAGAALVTVREGASILGGVSLGAGADELVLAGGDFGGITSLDGGPGRDALRIEAGRGSLPALSNGAVSGVESVIVTGDAVIEGDLLLAEDAGELVFADGARIDGHGRLDGGGGASLSLRGVSGEMDAARLSGWTSLEIGEGSRVTLAGAGLGRDAAESLSVAGTMAFGSDARAGDAFTVEGDFEGGGRVEIDADLAAGLADRLVIEGDVIGTTEIALRDLTPSGAGPSGAEMAVVSVGGEADASAFRLAGGAVARGAFLYDLRMAPEGGVFSLVADGGVSDTGAALRSSDAAIARGLARATTLQARAAARAATSVWARIGSAATFAERGAALAGRDAVDLSARESRSVWMRLHGDRWDYGAGGAASIDSSGFEFGMDLLSRESSAGKWIAGLTAQYGTVGAEAAAGGGVGRQGASGYGVGATLSWLGYGGFYADAQAQAGISDSDFSSDTGGAIRSGVSARTAVAALELGWRVAASDSATIVPQAQISMSGVSGDGFVSGSLDVAESSAASLDGRIGLAAEIALREGYLRFSGSLLRALSELDGTVINGRTVEHGLPGGWAEFAVGGSLDLSEDRVLFLDGTWRTGLGGGGGDAGGASISGGLKVNW